MELSVKHARKVKCKTRFCEWLYMELERTNMTMEEVGNKINRSSQLISGLATGRIKPNKLHAIGLCYAFKSLDDPDWVWSLSNEELT